MPPLFLGKENDSGRAVRVDPDTRALHMHIIGSTGEGKSKFMEHMIREDILANEGLCLIDPHGYLYEDLVRWCETEGFLDWHNPKKIILFEPGAEGWTFGFNPLKVSGPHISVHVDAMVKAVATVWGGEDTDRTPLLKRCLRTIFYALADKGLSLTEARFLYSPTAEKVREFLTKDLRDPEMQEEWFYFNDLKPKQFVEELGSTRNRMIEFLASPLIRTIVGQIETTINFREIMDKGCVLLVNLASADKMSEDNAQLLGSLIVNDLFMKARGRPKGSRPFYLYIDECSLFVNEDIGRIITEGRKFGLHLICAHQNLAQLQEAGQKVYSAIMSIKTKAVFGGLTAEDAKVLAEDIFLGELDLQEQKQSLRPMEVKEYIKTILRSHSRSTGYAEGQSHGRNEAYASSTGASEANTIIPGGVFGDQHVATNIGSSQAHSVQTATSQSSSTVYSDTETEGVHEAYLPHLGKGPAPAYSLEEQIYNAMALMVNQPQRHAIIKLPKKHTKFVETPFIQPGIANESRVQEFKSRCFELAPFINPRKLIEEQIQKRQARLVAQATGRKLPPDTRHQTSPVRKEDDFWEDE